jgi:hypothetical protein
MVVSQGGGRRDAEAELNLPPGFRFHPTDEELVVHYLCRKVACQQLPVPIIAEVDLYKFDPWDLPGACPSFFPCSLCSLLPCCAALPCFLLRLYLSRFQTKHLLVLLKRTIFSSLVDPFIQTPDGISYLGSVPLWFLSSREGAVWPQGVVLLHAAGPQVPKRLAPQPRRREGVLEGNGRGQADRAQGRWRGGRNQEGSRLLLRQGAQGIQDRLDHA